MTSLAPRPPDVVRDDGELLVVSHGAKLGAVCVKCATGEEVGRRLETLQYVRPWAWLWLTTGVLGIVIVSFLQRTAVVELPVCGPCEARWRRVIRLRSWVTLSLIPLTLLAVLAFVGEARGAFPPGTSAWLALVLVVGWGVAFAAVQRSPRLRGRTVTAATIDRQLISLRGVHPEARAMLVREPYARRPG